MTIRKALTLVVVLAAAVVVFATTRYTRPVKADLGEAAASAPGGPAATLRFFRNPMPVATFGGRDLDGHALTSSAWRGKVIIVNFWATWCGPCRAEIPDLVALQEKYRDQLQIIGISEDEGPIEDVKQFAAAHHVNYPVVMSSPEIRKLFPGVSALPTSFFIDRESRLVQKHVGMLTASLTELEARALAGLPVSAKIEEVDQAQGLKLGDTAQAIDIPGVDLSKFDVAKRTKALQKLNSLSCTCGCDLTVARCRVDDPTCSVSLPIAREIVEQIAAER